LNRRHELQCITSSSKIKTVIAGIKAEIDRATTDSGISGSRKNYKSNSNTVSDKLIRKPLIAK
jgi:hypothetical protein